jgi:hypothetical protein
MWIYTSTPHTPSWRSAQLVKGRDNFSFLPLSHGMRLSPLGTAATVWPIVPAPDDR